MTYLLSVKSGADYYPLPAPATMPSPAGFYPPTGHHTGTDFDLVGYVQEADSWSLGLGFFSIGTIK